MQRRKNSIDYEVREKWVSIPTRNELIAGLSAENVNTPLGRMTRGGAEYPLRVSGKPELVEQFRHSQPGKVEEADARLAKATQEWNAARRRRR